jgi:hypothetical protein
MQQEERGVTETQVPMQVHNHNSAFTSFTDPLNIMSMSLMQLFWTNFNIALFQTFPLVLQGSSDIDDMSVQDLL